MSELWLQAQSRFISTKNGRWPLSTVWQVNSIQGSGTDAKLGRDAKLKDVSDDEDGYVSSEEFATESSAAPDRPRPNRWLGLVFIVRFESAVRARACWAHARRKVVEATTYHRAPG